MTQVSNPFSLFTDTRSQIADGAFVYIGLPNQDPETAPKAVYWDAAFAIPAAQPLRTVAGYIVNAGSPATPFVSGAYSIRVRQANGAIVYSNPSVVDGLSGVLDQIASLQTGLSADDGGTKIGFKQSGTGAVVRTMAEKTREFVSSRDFGAVGNGVANDTAVIQAGIDAVAGLGGGPFHILAGTYRIRELRLKSNVDLIATGNVVFKLHTPATAGYVARALGQTNILVEGITFDCTTEGGNTNNVGGVQLFEGTTATPCSDVTFRRCTFRNAQNVGWLEIRKASRNTRVIDCQFYDHHYETTGGTHGLSIAEDSDTVLVTRCIFDHPSGSTTADPSRGHIGIDRATNVVIDGCVIRRAKLNGITIEDNALSLTQVVKIINTTISECANTALQLESNGLLDLTVDNCTIRDNASYGLRLAAGPYFRGRISGTRFSGNSNVPNLAQSYAQLVVNLGAGNKLDVVGCYFETGATAANFLHIAYLNGDLSVINTEFQGGSAGYGIYCLADDTKATERKGFWSSGLSFNNVATPTFRVPQMNSGTWSIGGAERREIDTALPPRIINTNATVDLFDIETLTQSTNGGGTFRAELTIVAAQTIANPMVGLGSSARYAFTVTRRADGTGFISPVIEINEQVVAENSADRTFSGLTLTVTDVAGSGTPSPGRRARVSYRIDTTGTTAVAQVSLAVTNIDITWSGFRSAPYVI